MNRPLIRGTLSRRGFLTTVTLGAGATLLAACTPSAPAAAPTAPPAKPTVPAAPTAAPTPAAAKPAPATAAPQPTTAPAAAANLTSVWQGKTLTMITGHEPGGGFDAWARLVANHINKHLPGSPTVVVQNMPGASQRVAMNFLYAAKPDGLTLGIVSPDGPTYQLFGEGPDQGVRFDAAKFSWLGSASTTAYVLLIHQRAGVTRGDELRNRPIKIGQVGPGNGQHRSHIILREALGWQLGQPAFGFSGTAALLLGLERGDMDACFFPWESVQFQKADDIRAGVLRPLVMVGPRQDDPLVSDVPYASDLLAGADAETKQMLAMAERPLTWYRPFTAPPGMAPELLAGVRTAFLNTLADPGFKADAGRAQFQVAPVPGERLDALIGDYMQTPKAVIDRMNDLVAADTPA